MKFQHVLLVLILVGGTIFWKASETGQINLFGMQVNMYELFDAKPKKQQDVVVDKPEGFPTSIRVRNDAVIYQDEKFFVMLGKIRAGSTFAIQEVITLSNGQINAIKIKTNGMTAWVKAQDVEVRYN